jgi:hypothetical protein
VTTPLDSLIGSMAHAKLVLIEHTGARTDIPLRFNPTEYQIQKQNTYAEVAIPGLDSPPLQFVRGGCARLTTDVLVDTSDSLDDVRERYLDKIHQVMKVESEKHAPPRVAFVWDREVFTGVLEQATTTYQLFTEKGVPIRAKVSLAIKEHVPVEVQVNQARTASPDFDKAYTVRRGDTLTSIAAWAYKDATAWRAIALANDIRDPRRLVPGTVLALPRLR